MKRSRHDNMYLKMAEVWADLSYSKKKKVGCIIVKDESIIADGYNGTPSDFENSCEDSEGKTKWYVLHAEANAILKVARSTQNCDDATLYTTLSPCKDCAKLILQSGIKNVFYYEKYKDEDALDFLERNRINCVQLNKTVSQDYTICSYH